MTSPSSPDPLLLDFVHALARIAAARDSASAHSSSNRSADDGSDAEPVAQEEDGKFFPNEFDSDPSLAIVAAVER